MYAALALRQAVFVVEQHTTYQEVDGGDLAALHVWGMRDGQLVAYLRLVPSGETEGAVRMERVVVDRAVRGQRLGEALVREGLRVAASVWPARAVRIEALAHLQRFYAQLGFAPCGAPYVEHGWAHRPMSTDKIR